MNFIYAFVLRNVRCVEMLCERCDFDVICLGGVGDGGCVFASKMLKYFEKFEFHFWEILSR